MKLGFTYNFCVTFRRLSYHQRIMEMMPETYAKLLPVPSQPNYKYASEEAGEVKRI